MASTRDAVCWSWMNCTQVVRAARNDQDPQAIEPEQGPRLSSRDVSNARQPAPRPCLPGPLWKRLHNRPGNLRWPRGLLEDRRRWPERSQAAIWIHRIGRAFKDATPTTPSGTRRARDQALIEYR